jgi:hypothetical protein
MASSYLTPTTVAKAAAVILHQRGKFLRRINQQYDAQYSDMGVGKGGGSVKIRLPNQYSVRTGTTMNVQDTSENSVTLTIGTMKGVDLNFSDSELALSIENFSKRILEPAIKVLVSNIEQDLILDAWNSTANIIDNDASAISFLNLQQARQKLVENLVPDDSEDDLSLFLSPTHNTKYMDAVKGLFVPTGTLGAQYKDGMTGLVAGVGWVGTSTHLTDHVTGTAVKATGYTVNGASQTGASITIQTGSTTFLKGDKVTFAGCNEVHAETKADLGYLKMFTVTADSGANATTLAISPAIVTSGGTQNCTASPTSGGNVVKLCAAASEKINTSLYFHRDFYAVSFADLENPRKYGAWGDVQEVDGVSVRIWRQGDIVNGKFPTRMDVFYGGKCIRPQLACGIHADG